MSCKDTKLNCSKQSFIHSVTITTPECTRTSESIRKILLPGNYEYYYVHKLHLAHFLNIEFIGAFIKNGKFFALSCAKVMDAYDCVALYPTGLLVLCLTKETYEELGLQGKKLKKGTHVVEIDLLKRSFHPGKPNYDNSLKKLTERTCFTFDFVCTWEPISEDISSRSVFEYIRSWGCNVDVCMPGEDNNRLHSVPTPNFSWTNTCTRENNGAFCGYERFLEWLGLISYVGPPNETRSDEFISTYCCPEPNHETGQIVCTKWTGFLTSCIVEKILDAVRCLMTESNESQWMAVSIQGFEDEPQRARAENSQMADLSVVVFFPGSKCWNFQCRSDSINVTF